MIYGSAIGKRFREDGRALRFPGNTVVADITPDSGAYAVMQHLHQMVVDAGMDKNWILLPEGSYHMTVIQGVNDLERTEARWPSAWPMETTMAQVDDYVSTAFLSVGLPGPARMKFDKIHVSKNAVTVRLVTADEQQEKILRDFRDRAATALGHFIPNHALYRFHISLAYVRVISEGEDELRMNRLVEKMNDYLANQPVFSTSAPYMAYFNDMMHYSSSRLPRD